MPEKMCLCIDFVNKASYSHAGVAGNFDFLISKEFEEAK
jgi:hypothetical protein